MRLLYCCFALAICIVPSSFGQPSSTGSIDLDFRPVLDGHVYSIAVQTDGKLVIGGSFATVNGTPRSRIARLNPDGSLDESFDPGSGASEPIYQNTPRINRILLDAEGRILIGGHFQNYDGQPRLGLARVLPNGRIDPSFVPPSGIGVKSGNNRASGLLALLPNGRILAPKDRSIVGLHGNGSLDSGFSATVETSFPGSGGPNQQFFGGEVWSVAVQTDGHFFITGDFVRINGHDTGAVARLKPDEQLDAGYRGAAWMRMLTHTVAMDGADRVLVAAPDGPQPITFLRREQNDGRADSSFQIVELERFDRELNLLAVNDIETDNFGRILVAGTFDLVNGTQYGGIVRLNNNGSVDESFQTGAGADKPIWTLASVPGSLFVGGEFSAFDGTVQPYLIRLIVADPPSPPLIRSQPQNQTTMESGTITLAVSVSGEPTPSFQWKVDGTLLPGATNNTLVLTNVTLAQAGSYTVVAANSQGEVESSPAIVSILPRTAPKILVQPANRSIKEGNPVVFSVGASNFFPLSYQWYFQGTPIEGETNATLSLPNALVSQAGEYHVVVSSLAGSTTSAVALLEVEPTVPLSAGMPDPAFAPAPGSSSLLLGISSLRQLPDGKILAAGDFSTIGGATRFGVARLNANGTADESFNANGLTEGRISSNTPHFHFSISDLVPLHNGKFLMVSVLGGSRHLRPDYHIRRLNLDGSHDASFNTVTNLAYEYNFSIYPTGHHYALPVANGRTLVGGSIYEVNGKPCSGLYRLLENGALDPSFDSALPTGSITFLAVQEDGRIIAEAFYMDTGSTAITRHLHRLEADGSVDLSFNPEATLAAHGLATASPVALQKDSKILVASVTLERPSTVRLGRLNPDGSWDAAFADDAEVSVEGTDARAAYAVHENGKIIVAVSYSAITNAARVFRFFPDGTPDPNFNSGHMATTSQGLVNISTVVAQKDRDILIGGNFHNVGSLPRLYMARLEGGDPQTALQITTAGLDPAKTQFTVSFFSENGRTYTLEGAESLESDQWSPAGSLVGNGAAATLSSPFSPSSPRQFFRIRSR